MTNQKYVILFNGPPRSGKDTYANELLKYIPNAKIFHLAQILKDITHAALGLNNIPYNFFEENKDLPNITLYGKTPRECYIQMSEHFLKPLFGESYFIKKAIQYINDSDNLFWIIPDCGFDIEVENLSTCLNFKCFYIILDRDGKNFTNDSRKYVDLKLINAEKDGYLFKFIKENMIEKNGYDIYCEVKKFYKW